MATGNNITNFTAADIEKYHNGQLSAKEMHDLERASLDDPFLADALEGYAAAGDHARLHLAELRTRLAEKVEGAAVVNIHEKKQRAVPWLRVAAFLIIIGGAALLANQVLFNPNKKGGIAKTEKNETPEIRSVIKTEDTGTGTTELVTSNSKNDGAGGKTTKESNGNTPIKNQPESVAKTNDEATKATTEIASTNTGSFISTPAGAGTDDKTKIAERDLVKEKTKDIAAAERKKDADGIKDQFDSEVKSAQKKSAPVTTNRNVAAEDQRANAGLLNQNINTFRGRVTDANNVGVPFANVTNAQDNNAGTYADAKGYFNLTYPDSVLTVQVRSIGFENANVQLRNDIISNRVILQDDRRSLSEVVISDQKPNATARNQNANMKLEEPEPADGWDNYDAYLANNLNAPEEIKTKQNSGGQVQLSFEVNKEGEPVNIRVEKSLCSTCDKEAIRLIKDGPKWKRNAKKKGRTMVTINF